jgi:hypothetical protein
VTILLKLPPDLEDRLDKEAARRGLSPDACAAQVLDQHLPPAPDERRSAAVAVLQQWMREDAQADDSDEAEEFFRNLDADRTSNRPLFPPEFKGTSW